jgi:hypothetical protein
MVFLSTASNLNPNIESTQNFFWMENVMESTSLNKLRGFIASQIRMTHFNEYYEERLEDEYLELSVLLNKDTVYDFVSRNNNARSMHRQY